MPSRARIARLQRLHALGLGCRLVIVADQMQKAMDDEMAK